MAESIEPENHDGISTMLTIAPDSAHIRVLLPVACIAFGVDGRKHKHRPHRDDSAVRAAGTVRRVIAERLDENVREKQAEQSKCHPAAHGEK